MKNLVHCPYNRESTILLIQQHRCPRLPTMSAPLSTIAPPRFTVPQGRRLLLALAGLLILGAGITAFFSHHFLETTFLWLVGVTMLGLGWYKLGQWVIGKFSRTTRKTRGFRNILLQALADIAIGHLLLAYQFIALPVLSITVGLLLLIDAGLQLAVARRTTNRRSRITLALSGLASGVVGIVAIILCTHPLAATWLSYLLGFKLILFGGALVLVAFFSNNHDEEVVYGSYSTTPGEKIPGELYAVTFGPAFHLGVYLGNEEVVDFHFDNKVMHVSWEDFALDRQPQRWEYPDLPPVPEEVVIATARAQIGKQFVYKAVTFNCENFAIYCKSGGKTVISRYAQAPMGLEVITRYPLLGSLMESFSRICNWIAYMVGGRTGRTIGLGVRALSARIAGWLNTSPSEEVLKLFQAMPEPVQAKPSKVDA